MANRPPYTDIASQVSGRSFVDLEFTTDSAGDVKTTVRKLGITSINHSTTGTYVLTFDQSWVALLGMSGIVDQSATYDATKPCEVRLLSQAVTVPGTRTVTIGLVNSAGALVNPTTDDDIRVTFTMQWNDSTKQGIVT